MLHPNPNPIQISFRKFTKFRNCFFLIFPEMSRQMKTEQMMTDNYMNPNGLSDHVETPIDLSRRCDSVETRKTPSPYNSSAFGGSSPSMLNESPNSLTRSSSNFGASMTNTRSDTPTNRYHLGGFEQRNYSATTQFPYENERTSYPTESMPQMAHHFMHEQSINSNDDDIGPYLLQVALQQKLQNIPATVSKSNQSSPESVQYPLVLSQDGKLARPFKAYPRDPLAITGSIPSTNLFNDHMSTERFNNFRRQMLNQIHVANSGQPTTTNPKMRRISGKSSEQNSETDFQQNQNNEGQQSDSSSNGNKTDPIKDYAYYERRRKNNAAAKKSRDRRRIKEDEIAIRAAFLERENLELKIELTAVKRQLAQFLEK